MMRQIKEILVDRSVENCALTERLLSELKNREIRRIEHAEARDRLSGVNPESAILPRAKRTLLLTRNPGSFFKYMGCDPGIADSQRKVSCRLEVFQGCPADCRYCFCQQYLSSHHVVVYANLEDMLQEPVPEGVIVTGDIADSLALGSIAIVVHDELSRLLPGSDFEIRSKFALPDNWQLLDRSRFRFDWSVSPRSSWLMNEPGTASLSTRIRSAARAAHSGYRIGIRLDPLQPDRIEIHEYENLLKRLRRALPRDYPVIFTVGSYKMTSDLLGTIRKRFPGNPLPGYEWSRCPDGKLRPFRSIRIESYNRILQLLRNEFPYASIFMSMEFSYILNLLDR